MAGPPDDRPARPMHGLIRASDLVRRAAMILVAMILADEVARYQQQRLESVVFYYGLPTTALLLLFSLGRLRGDVRAKLTLAAAMVATTVYGIEAALTATTVPEWERRAKAAREHGVRFDRQPKHDVIQEFRRRGVDAYPRMGPGLNPDTQQLKAYWGMPGTAALPWEPSQERKIEVGGRAVIPLGGISNMLTVTCNESGRWATYRSDEHGFHNPPGLYDAGNVSMAIVGDSFAEGSCVESDQDAVALVRQKYERTLNLGKGGNGPLLELATLKEYAAPLKPRIVLWFYYEGNDLENLALESRDRLLPQYLTPGFQQGLSRIQPQVDSALKAVANAALRQRLTAPVGPPVQTEHPARSFLVLRHVRESVSFTTPTASTASIESFRLVLDDARRTTASWGGQLMLVYLPTWSRYAASLGGSGTRQDVLAAARALGIPIVDMVPVFDRHPDPLALFPFRLHGHYTPEGYALVGKTLLTALASVDVDRAPPSPRTLGHLIDRPHEFREGSYSR